MIPDGAAELERGLAEGERQLADVLGMTLALERSGALRASLAQVAKAARYAVALKAGGPYVLVSNDVLVGASIAGPPPPTGVPLLLTGLESEPRVREAYDLAVPSAVADASRTVRALAERADLVSSEDFAQVLRWAPVVAVEAYRQSVRVQMTFDQTRRRMLDDPTASTLRLYWERAHLLGHLTLLAGSALPSSWLSEMAGSFTWQTWTPSFPLVRERMLRLAVRGGWMSARFGTAMTEPYLQMLEGGPSLRAFDGVIALVSIAVAFDQERARLHRHLTRSLERRTRARPEERLVLAALQRSAACVLDRPREATQRTLARGRRRLSSPNVAGDVRAVVLHAIDDAEDGAEIDAEGYCPAIVAMGNLATEPASAFFASTQVTSQTPWDPGRALTVLSRTGTARKSQPALRPPRQTN